MERYILGIDIGTTSVKVLLISESGALAAEGKADHDLISAHPGWAEENAEVWWSNAVAAVRQITDAHPDMAENIVSAGVSGMVPALVLNGENFSQCQPMMDAWFAEHTDVNTPFFDEEQVIHTLMDNFDALGLRAGALRVNGEICAFSTPISVSILPG